MSDPFAFARREHDHPSRNWHNCCGIFTRTAFGAPSIGDWDGDGSADAEDMWKAAKRKHPETDPAKIPRGVPVFWTGGRSDNGHAAVSRGGGSMWTTDLVRDGNVDVAPIADVARKWGLTLLGWTEDINGVTVWTPPPPPKPAPKPASKGKLRGGHASLRFDVSAGATAGYLATLIHEERLDFLTTTEAQQPRVAELLRALLGDGWRVQRRREYLIAWRKAVLAGRPASPMRRKRMTRVPGLEDWRNLFIALRGLKVRATGKRVLLTVGHAPAGIEFGTTFRTDVPERVTASKQGLARWGRLIRRHPHATVVAAMDSNLDQKRDGWRGFLTGALGAPSIWEHRIPAAGSHGARLIDTAHVEGAQVIGAHVSAVKRPKGMDHRAVIYTIDTQEKP